MDNTLIIGFAILAAIVIIAALLFFGYLYIKRKIKHKIIDVGAGIINKTSDKYLEKNTANKVNNVTNVTKEILKGDMATTTAVAVKGFEMAKQGLREENRKKITDKGADILAKTKEKYLSAETASKINNATNATKEALKNAAKKGLDIADELADVSN